MTSEAFRKVLAKLILVPIVALVAMVSLLALAIWRLETHAGWVDHTDQVIARGNALLKTFLDEETGIRGYLMTGDPNYLEPYNQARSTVDSQFAELDSLISDNPGQQRQLAVIRTHHEDWQKQAEIRLNELSKERMPVEDMATAKRSMDTLRADVANFIETESQLRSSRALQTRHALHLSYSVGALGALIAGLIIAGWISRETIALRNAFQQRVEEVRLREEWLHTTLRGIGDAVIACDLEARISFMNPVAEECTGWSEQEAVGRPLSDVFKIVNESTGNPVESPVDKVLRSGAVAGLANHTLLIRKDGSKISIDDSGAPIRGSNGEVSGVVLVFRDVTAQRKREAEFLRTEKLAAAGRLAASVAHEINNPLESVTNLIFLAASHPAVDESIRSYLDLAQEQLSRVNHISSQTLGFYRDSTKIREFRPAALIQQIVHLCEARITKLSVSVDVQADEDVVLRSSEGEVRQVVANLFANSLDAVGSGGKIILRARMAADPKNPSCRGVLFTVADDGQGIGQDLRQQIFEPFVTTKTDSGTGLGLWITKTLVERNGGFLRLRSRTNGASRGSIFTFFIPSNAAEPLGTAA